MARFLPIALLSFCFIHSVQADIYSASNALSRGDYETAVAEFTKLAEEGDASAQANLGYMYYAGEGVPQDYEKAVYWYRKAATQGNRDAQYNLAVSYAFGEGTKQDLTEAAIWYRRAGEQGHVVSQYSLGISYAYGEGVPQDQKEAARWFKKAADQGYARAQVHLGSMYHTGEGVEQDYLEASRWYRMAADRGDATAQYNLGTMYRSGKGVEQNYAQAKRWFRQSADQGYAAAQNELASLERSAAANVATRTIQAKPEMPIAKEATPAPEPEPAPKAEVIAEPVEETVVVQKTETTPAEVNETTKKPLFSVEKEGLLSLDNSELDIPEPETKVIEDEPEEVVQTETEIEDTKVTSTIITNDSPSMHGSLGLPAPDETASTDAESEGLFSKLFSSDESDETDSSVIEDEAAEETKVTSTIITNDSPSMHGSLGLPAPDETASTDAESEGLFSKLFSSDESDETDSSVIEDEAAEETKVTSTIITNDSPSMHGSLGLPTPDETASTDAESEGLFSKLFSSDESDETDLTVTEVVEEEPIEEITPEPEEIAQTVTEIEENKPEPEEVQPDTEIASETEESEGFFSRLFSSNEPAETDSTVTEVIEEEPVEEITPEPIADESETLVTDNNWAGSNVDNDIEENDSEESSGGLFSAIGKLFSGEDKAEQTAINEENSINENDDVLIAKVEEPAAVNEEIELAEQASTDLSQYSIQAGRRALTDGDYDEAFRQFQPLAESGDSEAQSHLGSLYYVGKGAPKDLKLAYNWYKKSADQGNVDSQYSIGNMYLLGEGIEQSNTEAAKWYGLASDQGHTAAKNNLQSLEKLEALNRENQLKLEAIAAEQEARQEESIPAMTDEPEEATNELVSSDTPEPVEEKSPGFFARLFGSDDENKTENITNIEPDTVEPEPSVEVLATETQIETVTDEADATEVIAETNEEITEQENALATATDETESKEESGGLLGFLGNVFSSDKEEANKEEIALLDEDTSEQVTESIEETASQNLTEEIPVVSEAESLRTLATQGDPDAQYKLGTMYYAGENIKQDYAQAALWYRRAAQQGNVDAQYSLGNMFLMGEGIAQDDEQAAQWYAMAAEQGHDSAKHNLDNLRKTYESNSPQIEETAISTEDSNQLVLLDDEPAAATSSEDMSGKAIYEQGLAYAFGDGVPQNDRTAFNLFYEAAEKGYVLAQYKLGVAFAYGEGVRQDNKKAVEWYRKAAEQGYTIAQRNLATMYLDGKGVEQNKIQALAWYQVVANAGNAMDVRRRDMLKQELSEIELSESLQLAEQISNRIVDTSL